MSDWPDEFFSPSGFRAEVKHIVGGSSGIVCYLATMKEAVDWVATWPDAVEAHITAKGKAR